MADRKTYTEAVQNIKVVIQEWIETAITLNREIPTSKGKLMFDTVKVLKEVMEKIVKETEKMTFAAFKEYLINEVV